MIQDFKSFTNQNSKNFGLNENAKFINNNKFKPSDVTFAQTLENALEGYAKNVFIDTKQRLVQFDMLVSQRSQTDYDHNLHQIDITLDNFMVTIRDIKQPLAIEHTTHLYRY